MDKEKNKYLLLEDTKSSCKDLLFFKKGLSKNDIKEIRNIILYNRNYGNYCIDGIIEEIKEKYTCIWINLNVEQVEKILY